MSGAASQFDIPPLSAGNLKRIRFLHLKKYRDAENAFLAEGARLCEEALASNVHIRQAVTTDEAMKNTRVAGLLSQCRRQNIPLFLAMPKQFDSLSEEQSPQGLAFVVDKPRIQASTGAEKLLLAVDHLQDPGNLGTILRSAEWFGVSKIVLGRGSVDVFNAKVVRASMGAIFRLSVEQGVDLAAALKERKARGWRIVGAAARAESLLPNVAPSAKDILVIGNEGDGLSSPVVDVLDDVVAIPGNRRSESLNAAVAASICLYHFAQFERDAGAANR